MNFNDMMILITGFLCFLTGILMVPMIDSFVQSNTGISLPSALIGVVDLIIILVIIYIHTGIVVYNQRRKDKSISRGMNSLFSTHKNPDVEEGENQVKNI